MVSDNFSAVTAVRCKSGRLMCISLAINVLSEAREQTSPCQVLTQRPKQTESRLRPEQRDFVESRAHFDSRVHIL
jgi:hypothetical protein